MRGADDPLYPQAVALVRKHKRGSIALVQRHLRIGWNQAHAMVSAMVGTVLTNMPPIGKVIPESSAGNAGVRVGTIGHTIPSEGIGPATTALSLCASSRDGDCEHANCPQLRDGEPAKTGRHCPLDLNGGDDE